MMSMQHWSVEHSRLASRCSSSSRHNSPRSQQRRPSKRSSTGSKSGRKERCRRPPLSTRSKKNVLVIDTSVLAPVVADGGIDGQRFRERIRGEKLLGPDLLRIEFASVLQRHAENGNLTLQQADAAIDDLLSFPITVYPTAPLLRRVWELHPNVSAYDACYDALAEATEFPLLTRRPASGRRSMSPLRRRCRLIPDRLS